jgi:FkbM family methyltransferase
MPSMKRAIKMLRPRLKFVAEDLFPEIMYARRFREWIKVEPELPLLPVLCEQDAIAIDIGANEGFFAHHLLPLAGSVIAFEPLPQMLERLRKRYANQMEIHGVVLSDHEGQGELRYAAGSYMSATIAESNASAWESGRVVETVVAPMKTLDGFRLTNVGFIKIDVEGHEEAVLRGGFETIKREHPKLMIEIEERHAAGSLTRVTAFLKDLGYLGFYLDAKRLYPISQFDPYRDQVIDNSKGGRYINNFLFLPNEQAKGFLEATRQLLSPGV